PSYLISFFFNAPPTPEIYTLSLHDALPISGRSLRLSPHRGATLTWPCFLVQDNHMVQTFSPYGTDHTLHKRSLPRTPPSPKHFLDLHDGDLLAKRMAINSISIPQQILRCEVKREGFQDLMRCPLCGRMSRYVEVHDTSPIMSHHDEDEQYLEQRRRHREKIDGGQLCRVILQKRPPGLRRWLR